MFPILTETELLNRDIQLASMASLGSAVAKLIEEDKNSIAKKWARWGREYYKGENEILKRIQTYKWDGRQIVDNDAPNQTNNHSFMSVMVEQKINLIAGKPPDLKSDNKVYQREFASALGRRLQKLLTRLTKNASNQGRVFLYPFIQDDKFKVRILPYLGLIPIYDTRFNEDLVGLIRYFRMHEVDASGTKREFLRVEIWDAQGITFLVQKGDTFIMDPSVQMNPQPHILRTNTQVNSQTPEGWGRLPLIEIRNNDEATPDLYKIKNLIDDYDLVNSDFSNNLLGLADALMVLKGYGGEDSEELRNWIKVRRMLPLEGEEADLSLVSMEVPHEAREKRSNRLRKDIFTFGMGYDPNVDHLGNDNSGVALGFLYAPLNMKADNFLTEVQDGVRDLGYFFLRYRELRNQRIETDPDEIELIINKTQITNEAERIENVQNSQGIISKRTQLERHPYVDDVEAELKRLEEEAVEITLE